MFKKIKSFKELENLLDEHKKKNQKVVQCHGVFDLLHPGHIRHLKRAKENGDVLVVSITSDQYVNKGPGRPVFNQNLRSETLAAMNFVDYVVINDEPDAINAIKKICPNVYFKGNDYKNFSDDVTGKISKEVNAVKSIGGEINYSDDIVFSSSKLLNQFFQPPSKKVSNFLKLIKEKYSVEDILKKIDELSNLKVLVVGDAIIDKYQYVESLGQSGKGSHMVASTLNEETFLGGSLIIANHLSQFVNEVTLLTGIGKNCRYKDFIYSKLEKNVKKEFLEFSKFPTLEKKRYVIQDGKTLTKLFETYSSNEFLLDTENQNDFASFIKKQSYKYDLILVADFANGMINAEMTKILSNVTPFLAINTQINSGNRGYNVITHYSKADYISLNEPEIRLAAHSKEGDLKDIVWQIQKKMSAKHVSITRGIKGVKCFDSQKFVTEVPALVDEAIDRIGAGDSYFALSSLCFVKKYPMLLSSFLGAIASSLDVQIVGNRDFIRKESLKKFLIRLMK